jgi:hypothetical protein
MRVKILLHAFSALIFMRPLQSAEAQQARKIRQLGVITVGTPVPLLTGFRVVNHDRRKRFHASPVGAGVDRDLGDVHWRAGAPRTLSLVRLPATSSWREVALEDKPGETVTAVGAFTVDAVTGQLSRLPGDHRLESLVPEVLV